MRDPEIGWIAAIVVGGIAGWLAEQFMKSDMGLLMNIVLGIVGAAIASAILSFFGIVLGGWIGYLISGFIGASLLIGAGRPVEHPPASASSAQADSAAPTCRDARSGRRIARMGLSGGLIVMIIRRAESLQSYFGPAQRFRHVQIRRWLGGCAGVR